MATKTRTIVYIDGFNLYYGAVKGTPHKWLDFDAYFSLLLSNNDIRQIRYFTALVNGPARARQLIYLDALATKPIIKVELGKFKPKDIRCRCGDCPRSDEHHFAGQEEKRTDVAIATRMIEDVVAGACEHIVLVSGDSDLVPAVECIGRLAPRVRVVVYVPARPNISNADKRKRAAELRQAAHEGRILPNEFIPKAQFPNPVVRPDGTTIAKPVTW